MLNEDLLRKYEYKPSFMDKYGPTISIVLMLFLCVMLISSLVYVKWDKRQTLIKSWDNFQSEMNSKNCQLNYRERGKLWPNYPIFAKYTCSGYIEIWKVNEALRVNASSSENEKAKEW
ncbi:hypothetical protein [Photobacterium rosenbergii]|uniref:hypothetical protein n=1 Tax=Photobacterium rosenbergii TaxID=294936 RepID=UPI001C99C561|nr:hypothetical protein [Photobacterium rosenbergii]MBY5946840.1 hypothetical protein [Photobacterium rosenbergii]